MQITGGDPQFGAAKAGTLGAIASGASSGSGVTPAVYVDPASPTFEDDLIASLIAAGLMDPAPSGGGQYWPMLSLTSN